MLENNLATNHIGRKISLVWSALFALILIILSVFILFLYKNFYLALISADDALVFQTEVARDNLNPQVLEKALRLHERRASRELFDWQKIRNSSKP